MTDRAVLLVDGPHAGQVVRVPENVHSWVLAPPFDPADLIHNYGPSVETLMRIPRSTLYQIHPCAIFGRVIEIGWSEPGYLPPNDTLAEHLLSAAAKEASR